MEALKKEHQELVKHLFGQMNDTLHHSFGDYTKMKQNTAMNTKVEDYYSDEHIKLGFADNQQTKNFENEQFIIILDGNIYNIPKLKDLLKENDIQISTTSDAEVLVSLYNLEKEQMLSRLQGMFAFLIWDKVNQELFAARDPFGIKPFFYKEMEHGIVFASTQQTLFQPKEEQLSMESLHYYLTFQYVPNHETMALGIHQLHPGYSLMKKPGEDIVLQKYYQLDFQINNTKTLETSIYEVRQALEESVKRHTQGNKSIGAYLSGGIDSTSVVSLARHYCSNLQTFTVGFPRETYNEMELAQETAHELDITNIQKVITPEEVIKTLPSIIWHLGDPVADPAAIPNYFVAQEASKHVDVVLSGEGADELFGGYNIYKEPQDLRIFDFMPQLLRRGLFTLSRLFPEGMKGKSYLQRGTTPLSERYVGNAYIFNEQEKRALLTHYNGLYPYTEATKDLFREVRHHDASTQMQYIDLHTWLKGDILPVAERMTRAHALEMRAPFLDKEIFKIARTLPIQTKLHKGNTKYVLRQAIKALVPDPVIHRKKLGFPVPIREWLKNELYDWAKYIIENSPTEELFHKPKIHDLLDEHAQQKHDHSRKLWTILTFMIWYEIFFENSGIQSFQQKIKKKGDNQQEISIFGG